MTTSDNTQQPQELTHRQQMGKQHSPLITGLSVLVIAFAVVSGAAKEMGYKDTKHMVSDAWNRAVIALSSESQQPTVPTQTFAPK